MELNLKKQLVFVILALVLTGFSNNLLSAPVPGLLRYVTPTGGGTKDGTSWANAYDATQLQTAIDETDVTQVWVAAGTYLPTADNDPAIAFHMKSGVAIYGGFAGNETTVDARNWHSNVTILSGDMGVVGDKTDNSYHVIYNIDVDNTAILDGFTIQGGNADAAGGGVFNTNSSPAFTNCIITNNSTFTSGYGAGMYNEASSAPTLTNCLITNNSTDAGGGGMYNYESSPTIINCTITRNSAGFGGGLCDDTSSSPIINNSIIWANSATSDGNQIYVLGGITTLNYSCYANSNNGVADVSANPGTFDASNNNITDDPKFANFINDFRLTSLSPCLDKGLDSYNTQPFDLRGSGYGRNLDKSSGAVGTIDMGAYEYKVSSDPTVPEVPKIYVKFDATGANNGGSWSDAYTSLQSALSISTSGCQIWVARGTYIPTQDGDQTISFKMKSGVAIYGGFAGNEAAVGSRSLINNPTILSGYIGLPADSTVRSMHVIFNTDVDSTAVLDGFTIQGGFADFAGGGIYNTGNIRSSSPTIVNCTITQNTTAAGGLGAGVYNDTYSTPTFINCVFSYNTTDGDGGGIYNSNASPKLINCTVTQNRAGYGGGLFNGGISTTTIKNSIFWGNGFTTGTTGDGRQMYINDGSVILNNTCYKNVTSTRSDISGAGTLTTDGTDIILDPRFVDPAGDFRIGGNSPCVDKGNDAFVSVTTDIRGPGFPRKLLGTNASNTGPVDMGAYEFMKGYDPDCGPAPAAVAGADRAICAGTSTQIGASAVTGHTYLWTSSPAGFTSTTSNPTVTPTETTAYTLVETVTATGCTNKHTVTVTVNPTAAITSPATAVWCNNTSNTYTAICSISTATFTWSRAAVTGITNTAEASRTGATITETLVNTTASPIDVHYKITVNANGCSSVTKDVTVTVNPTVTITSPASVNWCNAVPNTYNITTGATSGTVTYTWKRAAVTGINNTAVTNGTGSSITETLTNYTTGPVFVHYLITPTINGCVGTTKDVLVTVIPTIIITSDKTARWCSGSSNTYTPTCSATSGTISYVWTRAAVAGISNPEVTNGAGAVITETLINTTDNPIVVHYMVAPIVNGCKGNTQDVAITVAPAQIPPITGSTTLCSASTGILYTTPATAGHTYAWTISGGTITAGATTNSITVTWGSGSPAWVKVFDTPPAPACTSSNTLAVTLNPAPAALAGTDRTVCANAGTMLGGPAVTGSTYSWTSLPAGFTSTLSNPTVTTPVTTTYTVVETDVNGCTNSHKVVVTIPVPKISGVSAVCAGTAGNVYTTETGMSNYVWTVSSGGVITSGGTSTDPTVTVKWNTPGDQTVKVNYTTSGGCTATNATVMNVLVNWLPDPTITGSASECIGATGVNYTTEASMTGYIWTISPGGVITAGLGTNKITVNWNTAGNQTVSVNYTNANGCTALLPNSKAVTVTPTVGSAGAITGSTTLCGGSTAVTYSIAPVTNATSYTWTLPAGATIATGANTASITVNFDAQASSGNVTVYGSNSCFKSNTSTLALQVTPLVVAAGTISGPSAVCQGSTGLAFSVPKITNATSYTWTVPTGAVIVSGLNTNSIVVDLPMSTTTGPISVYGSNSCGKGTTSPSFILTVNLIPPMPVITPSGSNISSSASAGNQWYFSSTKDGLGAAIPGATNQLYTPTENGYYWVVCTLNTCVSPASSRVFRLKAGESNRYNVYPVPNDGQFTISIITPDDQEFTVMIFDQLGKKLYEHTALTINGEYKQTLNLKPAATGIYTIMFKNKDGKEVRKFNIFK